VDAATATGTMRLTAIWRYPVKSLQGEEMPEALLEDDGLRGDRCWGIRDESTGKILTGRREPRLLLAAATLGDDDEPTIVLPSGDRCRGTGPATDAALSDWLGRPVAMVEAAGAPGGEAEFFADATDDSSPAIPWTMPADRFVDAAPLLVLTTASLRAGASLHPEGAWEVRRFRPNLLVDVDADGWVEDGWCGRTIRVGSTAVVAQQPCVRCTMVTRPQQGLVRDLDIYRTLAHHHGGTLGVWTLVHAPGSVAVDDTVAVLS
jgi:MOSC domain-containing protein